MLFIMVGMIKITELIANEKKYKISEIIALFPEGYKSILELYLYNADMMKWLKNVIKLT